MADPADEASELTEQELARQIAAARKPQKTREFPCGDCWYCGEPVEGEKLFCDSTCSTDYEWEKSRGLR